LGGLLQNSGIPNPIQELRCLDTKPAQIHATKEVEKAVQIPTNDDICRLQAPGSSPRLDQDEQMAICEKEGSSICPEPPMVPKAGLDLPTCLHSETETS
jgi:hypothetical protein